MAFITAICAVVCVCDSLSLMPSKIDAIARFNFINGIVFEHMLDIILTFIFFSLSHSLLPCLDLYLFVYFGLSFLHVVSITML